jgi:hypothetical protein
MKMSSEAVVGVINVVNLYAVALDCQRWELFDQVFTADAEADFGGPARWQDRAALKRDFAAIHSPFDATQHVTTNHQVVVDGDRANCISYVVGRFIRTVPEGGNMFESGGWYDDRLVRAGDGWRISNRLCRMVWWSGNPRVLQTTPGVPVEQQLFSLKTEAEARRIAWLDAMAGR